ncbi:hypothetical protein ACO0SA_000402 [Hanseniaspora valbyensis]
MRLNIISLILVPFFVLSFGKNVDSRVDNSKHTINLQPKTHHSLSTKRETYLNNIALDIDKSNSIFNTYLRDIPIIYSHLDNSENEIVLLSVADYNIHVLDYKVWQFPRHIYDDMSALEKEIVIRENIIDFVNDYVFNLKNTENKLNLKNFIKWLQNDKNIGDKVTLNNENGKTVVFQKSENNKLKLDNGYQTLVVDISYNIYENGIVFLVHGCFDKRIWN